jgi:hypothetical protein
MELTVDNRLVETGVCYLHVPDSRVTFSKPAEHHNAGDMFPLTLENTGGKPGEFNIEIRLTDEKGIDILNHQSTGSLAPGEQTVIEVSIPADVKSGYYLLSQQAVDVLTNQSFRSLSRLELTGISASLNSITLKDKYFDDEAVSGKTEMVPGSGGIENGVLLAKIIRYAQSKGVEEEGPGEFIPYNMIEKGIINGSLLYLVSDKGVLRYDVVSGKVNVLYSFAGNPGFNSKGLMLSSAGELWIASTYGIWKQNSGGQWDHYTTAHGLANNWIYNIIEVNGTSGAETWAATSGGISVFRNNQWENYTTADGLPANRVYRLALDGSGAVWASTSGGVVKFNGINFESVDAPFGSTSVSGKMTGTADGSMWMVAASRLYRYQTGIGQWDEWNFPDLDPGDPVYISSIYELGTVNGQLWMRTRLKDAESNFYNGLTYYDAGFISYSEIEVPGLAGLNFYPVIPSSADGSAAYFTCEVGFMAFDTATWKHNVINMDSDKFSGEIQCLITDSLGLMWAGTDYGFSMYDGSQWTNYYSIRGSQLIFDVMLMDTGSENRVYGYCSPLGGILKLDINNSRQISGSLNSLIPWVISLNTMIKWRLILLAESGWEEKTCITMMENGISTRAYVM